MVRTAIARLAALALAAALPTAILHAEAALPGESCCDIRTIPPPPPKTCCSGAIIATAPHYNVVRDCDDRQGWKNADRIVTYEWDWFASWELNDSVGADWYAWKLNATTNALELVRVEAGTDGAFFHNGVCTCRVERDTVAFGTVYVVTNAVVACSGGKRNASIVEIIIGDI
jgi:hypothetical protein